MKHWKYLKYIIRHKWFVMLYCFRHGLYWRGLVHDLSKFLPSEWLPYANYFYGKSDDAALDLAWLKHQKRNKHHWQWWMLQEDDGELKTIEIPESYLIEMICDWRGAGRAITGWDNTSAWYAENRGKMIVHDQTRKHLDWLFGYDKAEEK